MKSKYEWSDIQADIQTDINLHLICWLMQTTSNYYPLDLTLKIFLLSTSDNVCLSLFLYMCLLMFSVCLCIEYLSQQVSLSVLQFAFLIVIVSICISGILSLNKSVCLNMSVCLSIHSLSSLSKINSNIEISFL
jgi:hypothetical protein